jgi:hypothetical protein
MNASCSASDQRPVLCITLSACANEESTGESARGFSSLFFESFSIPGSPDVITRTPAPAGQESVAH